MQKVAMYPGVFQMVLTMKCSVQVVTAGVLVDRDQSLVGVRQEDGHRVPLEVSCCFCFFVAVFSKRNRKHVLRLSIELRNTRESLGERLWLVFPQHVSFSQTSTRVSITRWKHGTCFLFLKYSTY